MCLLLAHDPLACCISLPVSSRHPCAKLCTLLIDDVLPRHVCFSGPNIRCYAPQYNLILRFSVLYCLLCILSCNCFHMSCKRVAQ